jgi:hypothetical protein
MNLRFISRRVQDSNPQVTKDIESTKNLLEASGVDYEAQDIGEPDVEYLAYLRDLLPLAKDSWHGVVKSFRPDSILSRRSSKLVRDASDDVEENIEYLYEALSDRGVDFRDQDANESDEHYLAYLRGVDDRDIASRRSRKSGRVKDSLPSVVRADRFSDIISKLDFDVSKADHYEKKDIEEDTRDGSGWYSLVCIKNDFFKDIEASGFRILLYGFNAKLTLGLDYDYDAGSWESLPSYTEDITDSELDLEEIAGIWVFKGNEPVLYIEGSIAAEDLDFGFGDKYEVPDVYDFDNYVSLESSEVNDITLSEIDKILEDNIGKVTYKAFIEN